mmetsp:Transcript_78813/g.217962  ORF Transcript_78813/g.217962 Transcript_78813/m.217962 type:complete len:220 (-) Transcript_78813:311-970(-)
MQDLGVVGQGSDVWRQSPAFAARAALELALLQELIVICIPHLLFLVMVHLFWCDVSSPQTADIELSSEIVISSSERHQKRRLGNTGAPERALALRQVRFYQGLDRPGNIGFCPTLGVDKNYASVHNAGLFSGMQLERQTLWNTLPLQAIEVHVLAQLLGAVLSTTCWLSTEIAAGKFCSQICQDNHIRIQVQDPRGLGQDFVEIERSKVELVEQFLARR